MKILLTWLMDEDAASAILGDLVEVRRRHARTSRMRATFWFWREVVAVAFSIGIRRSGEALRRWSRSSFGLSGGFATSARHTECCGGLRGIG